VQKGTIKQNRSCKSTLTAPQKMMTPLTSSKVIRHANAQVIAQQWELSCGGAVWAAL
jgi:predicted double-glycine peptidase